MNTYLWDSIYTFPWSQLDLERFEMFKRMIIGVGSFLALLHYVSRAHEIEIWPSSVRRSSVRVAIISKSNAWILPQITFEFFQTSPEVSPQRSSENTNLDFWILSLQFFTIFFVSVNMGPYGSKNFKTLFLPQIPFETFSEFSSQLSSQNYCFGFLKFWISDF